MECYTNEFYKEINGKEVIIITEDFDLDNFQGAYYYEIDAEGNEQEYEMDYDEIPTSIIEEIEEELDKEYFEKYNEPRREETAYDYEDYDNGNTYRSLDRWIAEGVY
jgi:hypothetical protein